MHKDGTRFPVIVSPGWLKDEKGNVTNYLATVKDITERKHMEAQLREHSENLERLVDEKIRELEKTRAKMIQTAKLASLGEMATGVAHELNQPLTAMQFEVDYLKMLSQQTIRPDNICPIEAPELQQIGENLAQDISRARRITDYLHSFRQFSVGSIIEIDLNHSLQDSFILAEARLGQHGISVQRNLDPGLPPILANPQKMEQVFLNLITNAEYALEEMAHRVQTGQVARPNYQKRLEISTFVQKERVIVEVQDNGCGISEADQPHIFEPFFTNRPDGEGAGLGLFISHSIVTEFEGQITFESKENKGAIFRLDFPATPS